MEASIRALYVSALQHRAVPFNGSSLWAAVRKQATGHPSAHAGAVLEARAVLGDEAVRFRIDESSPRSQVRPAKLLEDVLNHRRVDDDVLTPG